MRAPQRVQAPRDQGGFDRRWRDDEDIVAGKIGDRKRRLVRLAGARQRNRDPESRALAGDALDRDRAGHALDDPLRNGEAEAGAAELSRRAAIGLLELEENARLVFG